MLSTEYLLAYHHPRGLDDKRRSERGVGARCLELLGLPQPPDGRPDGGAGRRRQRPRAAGEADAAVLRGAGPDADGVALHALLNKVKLLLVSLWNHS